MPQSVDVPLSNGSVRCYSRAEAAKLLSVSERTLYERTEPRGSIKPLRMGRRVLYPATELERYIATNLGVDAVDSASDHDGGQR